jgi:hypothetical protein
VTTSPPDPAFPDRPGFFRTAAHMFYDPGFLREVLPHGARAAFGYVLKMALVVPVIMIAVHTGASYYQRETVIKPAFKDAPALSWQEGILKAEGRIPYSATVPDATGPFTLLVDTRDRPDTAGLTTRPGETLALTSQRFVDVRRGEVVLDTPYGRQFDGQAFAAGEAYRLRFGEMGFNAILMAFVAFALMVLFLMSIGAVISSVVGTLVVPEARQLGIGGLWTVAAHAITPGLALMVALYLVLASVRSEALVGAQAVAWVLVLLPLTVAVACTVLALRACTGPAPSRKVASEDSKPFRRRDDDLLPPDKV